MPASNFGELLRRYCLAAGLTQEELAERAGLSVRGISDLERRARGLPRKDTLELLLQGLELLASEWAPLVGAARRPACVAERDERANTSSVLPVPPTLLVGRDQWRQRWAIGSPTASSSWRWHR